MITRFLFIYSDVCLNAFWKNGCPIWHDKICPLKPPISPFETLKTPFDVQKSWEACVGCDWMMEI